MKTLLVYTINLVLILNCVIIVAKNESENKLEMKLNQKIFAEGVTEDEEPKKSQRIVGRKGVKISANDIANNDTLKSHDEAFNSSNVDISSTSAPITVHKNITPTNKNLTTLNSTVVTKITQSDHKTPVTIPVVSTNLSSTISITPKVLNTSTASISLNKTTLATSTLKTTTTTTTTKAVPISTTTKMPKKPEITYSAYDDPQILESEKNINYNVANEKSDELPKVEQDIDRTLIEEKRARNSYMLYLGLVFALPTTFVLINIAYRRIKSYLELRHYTRVDFLVDGMYVS